MTDRSLLRERYLRDPLPVRLGGLAANLARVRSFSDNPAHGDAVAQLLEESEWFIEWTAPDASAESQAVLVTCQRDIARWRRSWAEVWEDPARRADVAERANAWSGQFLGISGLVRVVAQNPATA